MVWGMNHPPVSAGAFYLAGEFEGRKGSSNGWRDRLMTHFRNAMTSAEQAPFQDENGNCAHSYAGDAIRKFALHRRIHGPARTGASEAIQDHEVPRYFHAKGNCSKLASLAQLAGPVLTADEPLKVFIEWLEPGVHQFIPIDVRPIRGEPPATARYILLVGRQLDSFSEERSDKNAFRKDGGLIRHSETPKHMRGLAFRRADMADAHLWHERRMENYLLCLSDRLQAEIADAGLRIPKHFPMREVD